MNDKPIGRKTSPGFADPHAPVRLGHAVPGQASASIPQVVPEPCAAQSALVAPARQSAKPPGAASSSWPRAVRRSKPLIEVEVVRELSRSPRPDAQAGCYEVWTQNHVYAVDARMRCTEVREVATGAPKADHPFLGSRLVGGQAQEHAMEMSHPLPRPGSCAVFEMKKGNRRHFTRTSAVERVVLRMRIVTIADGTDVPSWDELVAEDDE